MRWQKIFLSILAGLLTTFIPPRRSAIVTALNLRRAACPGNRPRGGSCLGRKFLASDGLLWLQGRSRPARSACSLSLAGPRIRHDGYLVIPRPGKYDSPAKQRDGLLAGAALPRHVPQRHQTHPISSGCRQIALSSLAHKSLYESRHGDLAAFAASVVIGRFAVRGDVQPFALFFDRHAQADQFVDQLESGE